MPKLKLIKILILPAIVLTLASLFVEGHTEVTYADIGGCEDSCQVVSAGFPFPFLADYPGLSVVNSVSLSAAIIEGQDKILFFNLIASFAFWLVICLVIVQALRRLLSKTSSF